MRKNHLFGLLYGLLLTAFTVYVTMDTFVITRVYTEVSAISAESLGSGAEITTDTLSTEDAENENTSQDSSATNTDSAAIGSEEEDGGTDSTAAGPEEEDGSTNNAAAGSEDEDGGTDSSDDSSESSSKGRKGRPGSSDGSGRPSDGNRKPSGESGKPSGRHKSSDEDASAADGSASTGANTDSSSSATGSSSAADTSGTSSSSAADSSNSSAANSSGTSAAGTSSTSSSSATASSANTGSSSASISAAVSSDTTYQDENISITLTEYTACDTTIYVADVTLSSADYLKTALAQNAYGRNVTQKTSEMAASNNAILAINGDYYGSQSKGYVLRNGVLYRSTAEKNQEDLVIYADGSFAIINESEVTAEELLADGAVQILSFGPALVMDGAVSVTADEEVGKAMASNPRTAIGIIDTNHYVFVVSDGRTDESEGLSLSELAEFMQSLGVTTAYNLDGGGSSTMYFNGSIVNNPTTSGNSIKERSVSDIVYIGY